MVTPSTIPFSMFDRNNLNTRYSCLVRVFGKPGFHIIFFTVLVCTPNRTTVEYYNFWDSWINNTFHHVRSERFGKTILLTLQKRAELISNKNMNVHSPEHGLASRHFALQQETRSIVIGSCRLSVFGPLYIMFDKKDLNDFTCTNSMRIIFDPLCLW